jgi:hypothetical protein
MKHFDYDWDLEPNYIKFDPELNIDRLGWQHGDYFKVSNVNGQAMLIKVDPLVAFIRDGAEEIAKPTKTYQFAIYSTDSEFLDVARYITEKKFKYEPHLNRTRFWIEDGPELLMFLLTWGHVCRRVHDDEDLVLGTRHG